MTEFQVGEIALRLRRFPAKQQHKSLQAWDSADELIANHLLTVRDSTQVSPEVQRIALFNDEFGALCCVCRTLFPDAQVHVITDSIVSQLGCAQNLNTNRLTDHVTYHSSLDTLPDKLTLNIIKIPRTLALLEYQLGLLSSQCAPATPIIAGAKLTALPAGVFKLFERYCGNVTTSLAKKKSRLLFSQCPDAQSRAASLASQAPYPTVFTTSTTETGTALTLVNHANVFSRQSLDIGARIMLKHLPAQHSLPQTANVIDLGCGNGVLGIALLARERHSNTALRLHFVDESYMAIASAKASVEKNVAEMVGNCSFLASNCLDEYDVHHNGQADLVLCNPPFHQQNTLTEHIARQMFVDAHRVLTSGGELRVVANRHLPYGEVLKKIFGGFSVVASEKKFVILSAIKR
ncbi:methyltransferase [Alteromonas sp. SM 2104]|nr:methyltransferase [Alteromonas oceanisediminis]